MQTTTLCSSAVLATTISRCSCRPPPSTARAPRSRCSRRRAAARGSPGRPRPARRSRAPLAGEPPASERVDALVELAVRRASPRSSSSVSTCRTRAASGRRRAWSLIAGPPPGQRVPGSPPRARRRRRGRPSPKRSRGAEPHGVAPARGAASRPCARSSASGCRPRVLDDLAERPARVARQPGVVGRVDGAGPHAVARREPVSHRPAPPAWRSPFSDEQRGDRVEPLLVVRGRQVLAPAASARWRRGTRRGCRRRGADQRPVEGEDVRLPVGVERRLVGLLDRRPGTRPSRPRR